MLYTDIPADVLERIEDVVLNRRPDAAERLIETAEALKRTSTGTEAVKQDVWREEPMVEKRLQYALIKALAIIWKRIWQKRLNCILKQWILLRVR